MGDELLRKHSPDKHQRLVMVISGNGRLDKEEPNRLYRLLLRDVMAVKPQLRDLLAGMLCKLLLGFLLYKPDLYFDKPLPYLLSFATNRQMFHISQYYVACHLHLSHTGPTISKQQTFQIEFCIKYRQERVQTRNLIHYSTPCS